MDAYVAALALLSRRELSAAQMRDRLTRKGFDADAIDRAITRLLGDGTLDDARVAAAAARLAAVVKGQGRRRVLQSVQRLGVSEEVAAHSLDAVFAENDERQSLERAIGRRLRGTELASLDPRARARLVRHLIGRGFAPSLVFARLRRGGVDPDG